MLVLSKNSRDSETAWLDDVFSGNYSETTMSIVVMKHVHSSGGSRGRGDGSVGKVLAAQA